MSDRSKCKIFALRDSFLCVEIVWINWVKNNKTAFFQHCKKCHHNGWRYIIQRDNGELNIQLCGVLLETVRCNLSALIEGYKVCIKCFKNRGKKTLRGTMGSWYQNVVSMKKNCLLCAKTVKSCPSKLCWISRGKTVGNIQENRKFSGWRNVTCSESFYSKKKVQGYEKQCCQEIEVQAIPSPIHCEMC